MTVQDYLLKFRKISSLESLENFLIILTILSLTPMKSSTCIAPPITAAPS